MQEVMFIADLHFGHGGTRADGTPKGAIAFRTQFKTEEEHDKFLVKSVNEFCNPTDTLILAGDIVVQEHGYEMVRLLHSRHKVLVPGNHDGERSKIPLDVYRRITGAYEYKYNGLWFVVTHIPIHPCEMSRWDVNVHGHMHNESLTDPRYVCISAECVDYKPVNKEWIYQRHLAKKAANEIVETE